MKHNLCAANGEILLMPMSHNDSEQYRLLRNREENRIWFGSQSIISNEQNELWYAKYINRENDYMFSVLKKANGAFLGGCAIYDIVEETGVAEFGRIIIRNDMRKSGYGFSTVMAALDIARELELTEVILEVKANNTAALTTYERAGFVRYSIKNEMVLMRVFL